MTRYNRKIQVAFQIETTYGQDPGSWAATHFVQLRRAPSFRIRRDLVPRELHRRFFGGSEHLVGSRVMEIELEVELAGAGAAGTVPAWGPLMRACSMTQTVFAANRVEYTPITDSPASGTVRINHDGVLYVSRGARGNCKIDFDAYGIPKMTYNFLGFDTLASASALATENMAAWRVPRVITDANSGDITLGSIYTAATGLISGGTPLVSRGLNVDLGVQLTHQKLLGGEAVDVTGRETMGSMSVSLTPAQEVTWRTDITNNALTTLSFGVGNSAGQIVQIFGREVQRVEPQTEDLDGRLMTAAELRFLPSDSGNDEFRMIVK